MEGNISLRPAEGSDFEKIFEICEARFGKGYMTREEYNGWLEHPEFCVLAECEGDFAGFVCYIPQGVQAVADYMRLDADYITSVANGKPVLHCKTAVMVEKYEHLGIMQMLVGKANDNGKALGYGAAFAPAWKYQDFVPAEKMLKRLGFKKIAERENIWYDMDGYTCVICKGKCRCPAVIFQKIL